MYFTHLTCYSLIDFCKVCLHVKLPLCLTTGRYREILTHCQGSLSQSNERINDINFLKMCARQ